jgi:hypothetical protein
VLWKEGKIQASSIDACPYPDYTTNRIPYSILISTPSILYLGAI